MWYRLMGGTVKHEGGKRTSSYAFFLSASRSRLSFSSAASLASVLRAFSSVRDKLLSRRRPCL